MKIVPERRAKSSSPKWFANKTYQISAAVIVFAVIGTVVLALSQAATPVASYEAEAGVRSGNASAMADAAASGGNAVKFSTSANSPSGVPMPTAAPTG